MFDLKKYIITRIIATVPMVFILVTIVFLILRVLPGNPALVILGEEATPDAVSKLMEQLGLNKPLYEQYIDFWVNIFTGNLGRSLRTGGSVIDEIMRRIPLTVELVAVGFLIGNLLAVLLGLISAWKGSVIDFITRVYSVLGYCIPVFWLGMMLQITFSITLKVLPVQGVLSSYTEITRVTGFIIIDSLLTGNIAALLDVLSHYALPWAVLALWYSSVNSRVLRSEMVEVLTQPYIIIAKAKGLPESRIIFKHALKNAAIPMVTLMGLQFAKALAGVVLTETVFNIPGMGRLFYQSIIDRDYPMVQGCTLFFTFLLSIVLLITDIMLVYIDPRIKYR